MESEQSAEVARRRRRIRLLRPHVFSAGQHSEGHYAARSVYGSILVLALLLALQKHPPSPYNAALLVAGTLFAVLAAETYADLLGLEIDQGRPPTPEERRDKFRELGVMTVAAEGPVVVFVLAGLDVIDDDSRFAWRSGSRSACCSSPASWPGGSPVARCCPRWRAVV
jgi:hypothetical protein